MDGSSSINDPVALRGSITDFLAREADYIDERNWDAWLALYEEEAEYWIPAWESEHDYTTDPQGEMSLIYYNSRAGLEDRVFRIRTSRSAASMPLPRTCHLVSNIQPTLNPDGTCTVKAKWAVHLFRKSKASHFFGRYDYLLAPHLDSWRIRKKKILVFNDLIPTVLDIYSV